MKNLHWITLFGGLTGEVTASSDLARRVVGARNDVCARHKEPPCWGVYDDKGRTFDPRLLSSASGHA